MRHAGRISHTDGIPGRGAAWPAVGSTLAAVVGTGWFRHFAFCLHGQQKHMVLPEGKPLEDTRGEGYLLPPRVCAGNIESMVIGIQLD